MKILLFGLPGEGEILIILIVLLIIFVPFIFYLKTLASTMQEISDENKKIPPSNMWLLLIPVFSNIYLFIAVSKLGESLGLEFNKRGIASSENKPGYGIGLAMSILFLCSIILGEIGGIAAFAGLVCWIIHWVKISSYKSLVIRKPHNSQPY